MIMIIFISNETSNTAANDNATQLRPASFPRAAADRVFRETLLHV